MQLGSYRGLDLFFTFDHQSLAVQSWDLTTFQTPLGLLHLITLPMGATNSVQIFQGDISFIIQEEISDIAAAFMDDVNIRGTQTCYETDSSGWYVPTTFTDLPLNWLLYPVPSAWMVNILRLFLRIQGFFGSLGSTSMISTESPSMSKKRVVPSQVGKWKSAYWKLWLLAIAALTKDVTQRITRFRRVWTGRTAIVSLRFEVSWVWQHWNLGQGF